MRPSRESWPFRALLLTLVLSPLPLGSVYQWSWAGIAVVVAILLALWSLRVLRRPDAPDAPDTTLCGMAFGPGRLWLPGLLFVFAVSWVAVQGAGWTPASWHHPIWASSAEALGPGVGPGGRAGAPGAEVPGSIALDPYDSVSGLLRLLTYAGVFWLAAQHCRDRERARVALWTLAVAGALYAAYGLANELSGSGTILWFEKTAYKGNVTSTFVNRNMYAAYAGLGFLCAGGLLLDRCLSLFGASAGVSDFLRRLLREAPNRTFLLSVLASLLLVAIGFTESRGGAASAATAFAILFVCLASRMPGRKTRRASLAWLAGGFVAAWVLVYGVAAAHLGGRFETAFFDPGNRLDAYRMTLSAIGDAPLRGYGSGSFLDLFYLTNDGAFWLNYNYAHNLYLGAAAELGLPAALALIGAVAALTLSCLRGLWRRKRDRLFPALGVAATGLVALHGLIDSPLYLPANALTYSFLLGLAYAQSWSTARSTTIRSPEPGQRRSARPPRAGSGAPVE